MERRELITIVEPDRAERERLASMLQELNHAGAAFATLDDLLANLQHDRQLALFWTVDANTGDLNRLREARRRWPAAPVVAVLRQLDPETSRELLRHQVDDLLVKPLDADAVRHALDRVFGLDQEYVDEFFEVLAFRLREKRAQLKLKQSEVAARCDLSASQVSQIEHRQSTPSLLALLRICRSLHLSMTDLVRGY